MREALDTLVNELSHVSRIKNILGTHRKISHGILDELANLSISGRVIKRCIWTRQKIGRAWTADHDAEIFVLALRLRCLVVLWKLCRLGMLKCFDDWLC